MSRSYCENFRIAMADRMDYSNNTVISARDKVRKLKARKADKTRGKREVRLGVTEYYAEA